MHTFRAFLAETARRSLYHTTQSDGREDIRINGLDTSATYVTTNPEGWLFMFEPDGIHHTEQVDVWKVSLDSHVVLRPDTNETADPDEDFIVDMRIPPQQLTLDRSYRWTGSDWVDV